MKRIRKTVLSLVLICIMLWGNVPMHVKAATTPPDVDDAYVLRRLSELAGLLGINEGNLNEGDGVYFTVNQQKCGNGLGGHSCDNCKNTDVANTEWFKNLFGTVTVGGFPKQYREDGTAGSHIGWSCWGFANFAMWYANSTQNTDNVIGTLVTTSTFTKDNILSLLKPGYIIRCNGHSMVFISADENTMKVMDSNWRYSSDGENSRVRIREFGYNDSEFNYFKGKAMGITGAGNYTPGSSDIPSPETEKVRAFAERMYTIVLGRVAEEQGLNDWTERLMTQEIDGATLVDMFVNSDEFINRNTSDEEYIKILYRAVLGREADADGLKMWKDMLADDWTRDYILEGLVLSVEFKNICDSYGIIAAFEPTAEGQVRSFVKRMYTVVLNRRADAVGLDEWTQRLMNGTANGAQIADGFISSDEFVNRNLSNEKYVKVLYRAFFNREADEGGFNVWMNELAKGASRRDVMKGFVHSVEFSDLCAEYGIIRGEIQ